MGKIKAGILNRLCVTEKAIKLKQMKWCAACCISKRVTRFFFFFFSSSFSFFSLFSHIYIYVCYIIHPFFSLVVIVADEHLKVIFINVILIFAET